MKVYIKKKEMPSGEELEKVRQDLNGSRTIPQIRARVNNFILGKQKSGKEKNGS